MNIFYFIFNIAFDPDHSIQNLYVDKLPVVGHLVELEMS